MESFEGALYEGGERGSKIERENKIEISEKK